MAELRKSGQPVRIAPQPFAVLSILLSRAGELVSRDDICRQIWGGDTFVDFELSLNFCLNRIRTALGDDSSRPHFIQTVPRRGYRFIAPVERVRTAQPTVAILPFANMGRDADQDVFADGVADALITELGNVSTLRVISRQSVLHLKGTHKTLPEIAQELKADAIVEGSVLHDEGRVRITAQLIQVDPEQHLWAKAYECAMSDILTKQGEIARAIAEAVEVVLTPEQIGRLNRPRPVDPKAHLAYLNGRHHMGHWSQEGFQRALYYFQLAIQLDPRHAAAYAHLADCHALLGHWGYLPFAESFQKAKQAASRALALDEALSTAHWAYAWASWVEDRDLDTCEKETLRALQLNPSDAHARVLYSIILVTAREDPLRAIAEAKLALDVDPLSQYVNTYMGWAYLFVKDFARAGEQAARTLELFPASLHAHYVRGFAEICRGKHVAALEAFGRAIRMSRDSLSLAYLGYAHARSGDSGRAHALLQELLSKSEREHVPPRCFVFLYAALGQEDRAFEWLDKAYQARDSGLLFLRVMPLFEPLRSDPRFDDMLRRIGIKHVGTARGRP